MVVARAKYKFSLVSPYDDLWKSTPGQAKECDWLTKFDGIPCTNDSKADRLGIAINLGEKLL